MTISDITPFLMFEGNAEEAMRYYVSSFPNSEIRSISRYEENESAEKGSVRQATFSLNGRLFMCIDSPVKHPFTFTPAISLFVSCRSESEVDELFARLARDGQVLMPLGSYPFSARFAWFNDKFGVSWQFSLSAAPEGENEA